jgi:hypothetical protein
MSTQANTARRTERTAKEREETLFDLAGIQEGLNKAMRHASKLPNEAHWLIEAIWSGLERVQRYTTDAQRDVRTEPYTPEPLDDAA